MINVGQVLRMPKSNLYVYLITYQLLQAFISIYRAVLRTQQHSSIVSLGANKYGSILLGTAQNHLLKIGILATS